MDTTKVRKRLEERRRDLDQVRTAAERAAGVDPEGNTVAEVTSYDQHTADLASETIEKEQAFSIMEMADESLRDVEIAMERLEKGGYGICDVCRKPIDEERLTARPETRFCVEDAPRST